MICAIENMRDAINSDVERGGYSPETTVSDFRGFAQDNLALLWADDYLASGLCECRCK
jgi:hypothetical protein